MLSQNDKKTYFNGIFNIVCVNKVCYIAIMTYSMQDMWLDH